VAINYERVLEHRHLAAEVLSGGVFRTADLLKVLGQASEGKLGRAYCTFDKPISVQEYLATIKTSTLNFMNLKFAALKLSQKLYIRQQKSHHITLTMVVAALLL